MTMSEFSYGNCSDCTVLCDLLGVLAADRYVVEANKCSWINVDVYRKYRAEFDNCSRQDETGYSGSEQNYQNGIEYALDKILLRLTICDIRMSRNQTD